MERLDIRDAVDGIARLLKTDLTKLKPVYNFSSGKTYLLKDIANHIAEITYKKTGKQKVSIENKGSKDIEVRFGMDSSRFFEKVNWRPRRNLSDSIESIIEYLS